MKETNIYGSKKIHLPSPQFVVFYNGIEDLPERSIMRLSDAQYAIFVDTVRKYEKDHERTDAVELAIDECIEKGVLADFLRKNRAEVLMLCLFEYDQEKHLKDTYEEGVEDGEKRGMEMGVTQGIEIGETRLNQLTQMLLADDRIDDLSRSTKDREYRQKLLQEYQLL